MNTHLRHLIQELRAEGWEYVATQTNGAPHFVHPQFGKVAVASTPADWEDECNYTRQRIRKATRRAQNEILVSVPSVDPLQETFAEIDAFEEVLRTITEGAPRLLGQLQAQLSPLYAKMVEERRALLALLGEALCNPRWKKRQAQALGELCLIIADTTQARLNVSLDSEFPFLQVLRHEHAHPEQQEDEMGDGSEVDDFDSFDADAWERWFDQQESNTTYHPAEKSHPKISETQPAQPTQPTQPHLNSSLDSRALGKKLYLGLARELHPDKTTNEAERQERTHLMKQLNAAHAKGDLRTLLSLLHRHGSEAQKAHVDSETTLWLEKALHEQRENLQEHIRQELAKLPAIDGDWRSILANPKLQEALLRKERRLAESEAQRLREIRFELQEERGIAELLRTTDAQDWIDVF